MKRKTKIALWSDVSVLIVAVIAITAFTRGAWQFWLLITAFGLWSAWAVIHHLLPFLKEKKDRNEARELREHFERQQTFPDIDVSDPVSIVLLRHVNHRISAHLQAAYPDATWDWCEEDPERIVTKGGTGRIRLHGIPDFNFAEITLDQNAKIACQLLKIVPFAANDTGGETEDAHEKPRQIDPQVWYEQKAKTVLSNLIADLNSRGHSSLTIHEDGSIAIMQANKDLTRPAFESVPERTYWPRLVKVFEREGIATDITEKGLVLSW